MHKMTFFPLGNSDCCRIDLECGKKILFDYADMRDPDDEEDLRCNLPELLREDLEEKGRDFFDIVAFTHLDKDHFKGFSEFFYLEHAKKYQGKDRIKINTMWVPAALITESEPEEEEARILQREARYRFREGRGIRIFSRPERLKEWCDKNGVDLEQRLDLITDAGKLAPEFSISSDGVEFFVHSPFAFRQDEKTLEDRNSDSIVMQITFEIDNVKTRALMTADSVHEALSDIVDITRKHNEARLMWDILKIPHHCSYLSLSSERGEDKTKPIPQISWLYEQQGQNNAIMVSTSDPIPMKGTDEDKCDQPPHRQAAEYYQEVANNKEGSFVVTMEDPKKSAPEPIVIEIGKNKAKLKKGRSGGISTVISRPTPRAG